MKMVKKILFGLVAAAAVLSLASCGIKKDDPEGIIKGSAGNYSVNYKYENADTDATYRAYKPTGFKHAGVLAKVTFDKDDINNIGNSKLGVIFGLQEKKYNSNTVKDFYIIGLGAENNGKYYISKFTNIKDIQAVNFGAPTNGTDTGENGEKEDILVDISSITLSTDNEGNQYAYIWFQVYKNGSIEIKIGDIEDDDVTDWNSKTDYQKVDQAPNFKTGAKTYTISQSSTGYDPWTPANQTQINAPQDYIAIYARVQGSKTLNGKVKFVKDFCEAEDIEQID